jgi:hypothetical protein
MTPLDDMPVPLGPPPALQRRRASDLLVGIKLLPERRLMAFSPEELEIVTRHWLDETRKGEYEELVRYGGTNDKGRDVAALVAAQPGSDWDNFQCKQYDAKLGPSAVRIELAKVVYWVTKGSYACPRAYFFVSPLGVTNGARDLLDDAEKLRKDLAKQWDKECTALCPYDEIKDALTGFAFPKLDVVTGDEIVSDLKGTPVYSVFFGGGLTKPRPEDATPPEEIADHEIPYITRLVEAYDEHCDEGIADHDEATEHKQYGPHLADSRRDFYRAESLREFSKDVLVHPDDYASLQDQVYDGVKLTVAKPFPDGYQRVLSVCEQATRVQLDDHPLTPEVQPGDRIGMCHQLANDGRVEWKNP